MSLDRRLCTSKFKDNKFALIDAETGYTISFDSSLTSDIIITLPSASMSLIDWTDASVNFKTSGSVTASQLVLDNTVESALFILTASGMTITASGGTIDFDNENLITDGLINGVELGVVGTDNYFFGAITTLASLTTGDRNIGIGTAAGTLISSGDDNICIGSQAGEATTVSNDSVFIGTQAGRRADTIQLAMIGSFSGRFNTGNANTFIGYSAGHGVDGVSNGANNTIIGTNAGFDLTSASANVFIGNNAGSNITSGGSNTFVGKDAGRDTITAVFNVFIGQGAGKSIASNRNVCIGNQAGQDNNGGSGKNVLIGHLSGHGGDGTANVFIGAFSGLYETGSNTFLLDNEDATSEALGREHALLYGLFENHASGPQLTINGDTTINGDIDLKGLLKLNTDAGSSKDIIISNGPGLDPTWVSRKEMGIVIPIPTSYISGTGEAGTDNTAQTIKTAILAADSLTQVGDRIRLRCYWTGDTGGGITGTVTVNGVTIAATTDGGAATFQVTEAWLHYIDNTHANIISMTGGIINTSLSAANVAGFNFSADQDFDFDQDAVANNHIILYFHAADIFPKGV